jgi:glucose-6-phosphate 1-dehydrogenase
MTRPRSDALVTFGASGDLAFKNVLGRDEQANTPLRQYDRKTWGPRGADRVVSPRGGWHNPVKSGRH